MKSLRLFMHSLNMEIIIRKYINRERKIFINIFHLWYGEKEKNKHGFKKFKNLGKNYNNKLNLFLFNIGI